MIKTTDKLFQQAVARHQAGKLTEARSLYTQVLLKNPRHINALNFMGVADIQLGEFQRSINPFERVIAIKPDFAEAHNNLGVALKELKRYGESIICCEKALSIKPNYAEAHYNLAVVLVATNRNEEAIVCYKKAVLIKPDYVEAYNNLGIVLNDLERTDEAADYYLKALSIDPNFPFAHCNLGGIHILREEYNLALERFKRALELRPNYIEALIGLSKTFFALEKINDAKTTALKANNLDPDNSAVHSLLGRIYDELTEYIQAETHFNRALTLDPLCEDALHGLAHLCMENGQMEKASELFGKSIARNPNNLNARAQLVQSKKITPENEDFIALQAIENDIPNYPDHRAIHLNFALGKCYDDIKDAQRAFPHFMAGATRKRASLKYDSDTLTKEFNGLMEIFNRDTINRLRGAGNPSQVPIFVLGMPRSGTTLTEQIIASHPDVHGAGELSDLVRVTRQTDPNTGTALNFPNRYHALDGQRLSEWGTAYIAAVQKRAPNARHITDKMPSNFRLIGLIHLMLPNAKIIHVRRNPVDTCLSCFTRLFKNKFQEFTYDLTELGKFYVDYERIMNHWRRVLPTDAFMEIQYEDIVADQASQARRLIEYCGLEWNDACLNFHETRRAVRTASLTQVRQPIYTSSVERWRPYEPFLKPLLDVLGVVAR